MKKRKIVMELNRPVTQAQAFASKVNIYFYITPIRGSCFVFKNAIKILTAEMVRYVTHQLTHAEYHVKRRKIVMVLDRLVSQAQAFA